MPTPMTNQYDWVRRWRLGQWVQIVRVDVAHCSLYGILRMYDLDGSVVEFEVHVMSVQNAGRLAPIDCRYEPIPRRHRINGDLLDNMHDQ